MVAFMMENVAKNKSLAKSEKKMGWLYECQVHWELYRPVVVPVVS